MSFFRKLTAALAPASSGHAVDRQLAITVLLLEVARADFQRSDEELALIRQQLISQLQLDAAAADELLSRASEQADAAISLHEFVSRLNAELDAGGKRELIRSLWQVAMADGRIEPHEEAMIRQIAELLFVPHSDFVQTRLAVCG